MTKAAQFIATVQTAFIANAINISLDEDARDRRAEFSATAALGFMYDALDASTMIPEDMSASAASEDFAGWMLENLREKGDTVPAWFARR